MDRKQAQTLLSNLDILKAYAEGQDVQYRCKDDDEQWREVNTPSFTFDHCDYRIKPRPIEGWVNVYEDGDFGALHGTKALAEAAIAPSGVARTVFVREVEN